MRVSLHYFLVVFYLTILLTRNSPWPASLPLYLCDACHQAYCVQAGASAPCCSRESWPQISFRYVVPSLLYRRDGNGAQSLHFVMTKVDFPSMSTPPVTSHPPALLHVRSTLHFQSGSGNRLAATFSSPLLLCSHSHNGSGWEWGTLGFFVFAKSWKCMLLPVL